MTPMLGALILAAALDAPQTPSLAEQMVAAEDARVSTPAEMAPLFQGLRASDPKLVIRAVRALGRFERPELVKHLIPFVTHERADVRMTAVDALGQALAAIPRGLDDPAPLPAEVNTVSRLLFTRLGADSDPAVVGVIAETLGRLPLRTLQSVIQVEDALTSVLPAAGAVKGLDTRIRGYQKVVPVQPATIARLRAAATLGTDPSGADQAFIRRVAWSALNTASAADLAFVDRGLGDPDAQVRRLAVIALGNLDTSSAERGKRAAAALGDRSYIVRYEAVRVYNRTLQATGCAPLLAAAADGSMHVALAAIDALGDPCPAGSRPLDKLVEWTDALKPQDTEWHRAAHAFVSLARIAPDQAVSRMSRFAEHPVWQVRMYAVRAAAAAAADAGLERLASDAHDNVREAAISALVKARGHQADSIYAAALGRPDYQLILTAANALKGSPTPDRVTPALVQAFVRITVAQRDTSRDPRMAILQRLQELGGKQHAQAIHPCVSDFDPVVARQCAETIKVLTGVAVAASPKARPRAPVPGVSARRARVTMRRGGAFELRLFPDEAPATVARVTQLARRGYYNGLTFHRVVPNFVLQGGSPGANEYMGDGPFMRDELGLRTHARGTLGISTRGRDTGDAQIFINLCDNPRLDHNYTVFAEITSGMDVVDAIVEGDVIERLDVDVLETAATESNR